MLNIVGCPPSWIIQVSYYVTMMSRNILSRNTVINIFNNFTRNVWRRPDVCLFKNEHKILNFVAQININSRHYIMNSIVVTSFHAQT